MEECNYVLFLHLPRFREHFYENCFASFSFHDMQIYSFSNATRKCAKSLYQKQPSSGVLRKMCSKNMHAANFIYRRTPASKCNLLNSHFDMGVFLQICCIFSEHIFLMAPLDGCFCGIPILPIKSFFVCESKLNLIRNCCFFEKYVLFVFCLLQFKPSIHYFHQYVVFSY